MPFYEYQYLQRKVKKKKGSFDFKSVIMVCWYLFNVLIALPIQLILKVFA